MVHHRRGLRRLLKDDDLLAAVEADWRQAPLSQRRLAMLTYAVKLTHTPGEMVPADLVPLRSAGFSDRDVLDIVEVTAYYAYVNRIADGLGVPLESWIPPDAD
ncbi:MAG: peroxidase-related enzyme [Actinomycetota bacterium]